MPLLTLFLLIPIAALAVLYSLFFGGAGAAGGYLAWETAPDLFTYALLLLALLLTADSIIHPALFNMWRYGLNRTLPGYAKQAVKILVDSGLIYGAAHTVGGVHLQGYVSALSLAVLYHGVLWMGSGMVARINKKTA
ncbi:hypothetical protein [Paenibacillus sp. KR2-11]|uniref:hypothetical protein n=1 Tax=Paenibacillus sp. KR2-11 TaxID=3385500 RepID=UPI0038FC90B2